MSAVISDNLKTVLAEILRATRKTQRDSSAVTLVAVTKNHPVEAISAYCAAAKVCGIPLVIGESYLQECKSKRAEIPQEAELHFIGPLQSNKIRDAVFLCDLIQSVHSMKVLRKISQEAERISKIQRVLLQVNISLDPNKKGFLPTEVYDALQQVAADPHISVEGLMTITALYELPEGGRADYRKLAKLAQDLGTGHFARNPPTLSMGMSADFGVAIEEGSTMVRVGTALFGER